MSDLHEVPGKNRVHCRLEEKSLTAAENKALQIFFPYIVLFLMRIILICKRTPRLRSDHTCQKDTRTLVGFFKMVFKIYLFCADKICLFGCCCCLVWGFWFLVAVVFFNRSGLFCLLRAFGRSICAVFGHTFLGWNLKVCGRCSGGIFGSFLF